MSIVGTWGAMIAAAQGVHTHEDVEATVRAYFDSWANGDVQARAALFAPDAAFSDPIGAPELNGLPAIQRFWSMAASMPITTTPEVHRIVISGDHALAHFTMHLAGEQGPVGSLEVFETFDFNDQGQITRLGPYWDRSCVTKAGDA
ncbi:MAG: nuclear transport factor 2 family protein [Proteobacteria bacterium]|nr:nuclear transport factor 2 family protein [Pseudomonadota bacterium]